MASRNVTWLCGICYACVLPDSLILTCFFFLIVIWTCHLADLFDFFQRKQGCSNMSLHSPRHDECTEEWAPFFPHFRFLSDTAADPPISTSKFQANASSPPPINWAMKPKAKPTNSTNNPQHPTDETSFNGHNLQHLLRHLGHSKTQQSHARIQPGDCPDGHDHDPSSEPESEVQELTQSHARIQPDDCPDGHDPSSEPESEVQELTSTLTGLSTSIPSHTPTARTALSAMLHMPSTNSDARNGPSTTPTSPTSDVRTTPSATLQTPPMNSFIRYPSAARTTQITTSSTCHVPALLPAWTSPVRVCDGLFKKKYYVVLVGKCTGIYYDEWYCFSFFLFLTIISDFPPFV